MLYLFLAVACSLTIGVIFKVAGRWGMDRLELLTANYVVAFGTALFFAEGSAAPGGIALPAEVPFLALGTITGALFIGGFFLFSFATEVAGLSLAIGVMRVSVVIPFVASWIIWDEVPSWLQGLGLGLAAAAFFLIARRPQAAAPGAPFGDVPELHGHAPRVGQPLVLALLFLAGGVVDVCMKTYDEAFAAVASREAFLLLVFGVAAVIGGVLVVRNVLRARQAPDARTVVLGVVLGVVNYGSAVFLLRAIAVLSGPFVFPANNIALVIGGALLGVGLFREALSRANLVGLGLAGLALLLLSQ